MAIFQRQYQKVLAQELLHYLLLGRLPNIVELGNRIRKALGKDGNTTYQYVPQLPRTVFNNEVYNSSLRRIKFDIDLFHEELLTLFGNSLQRLNYADLYHKVHSHELAELQAKLETILFTVENADFYFLGAYDTFTDLSKMDKDASTAGVIDLSEQAVMLPYGGRAVQRVDSSHLHSVTNATVEVLTPEAESILSEGMAQGTSFSNIFIDTTSAWAYEIVAKEQIPVEIKVSFPLAGAASEEAEVFINRVEVIPHSPSKTRLIIKFSTDNINFLAPTGYEDGVELSDQRKTYALDFETNLVQYVELTFRKETPDEDLSSGDTKAFQYLFGLKSFSAYTVGRVTSARYQSLPFDFTDEEEQISNVSMQAETQQLPGTKLNYSVALADDGGITSSFIPITPVNKGGKLGVNQVVSFGTTAHNSRNFYEHAGAAGPHGTAFQGINFYKVSDPISPTPVFGSCRLYRGYHVWYRDISQGFENEEVTDNYVSFESTDLEALYALTTEIPSAEQKATGADNIRRVLLTTNKYPYYDSSRGHAVKPQPGVQQPSLDIKPNYAIYRIEQIAEIKTRSETFLLGTTRSQLLPSANFLLQSADPGELPELSASNFIYQQNKDYVIETEDIGGRRKPTGIFTVPDGSSLLDPNTGQIKVPNLQMTFRFTNDADITHKAKLIEDNFITLENAIFYQTDTIKIRYRYIPVAPSSIIKASIRVSDLPSTSPRRMFYVEGTDYVVDPAEGAIQRIPTGSIPNKGSVYVQFSFRNAEEGMQTFQTWCHITNSEGAQIRFELDPTTKKNKLQVDNKLGEAFFVNTADGLIELTKAANTPVMSPGWVQFVVRSKNPDANVQFGDNLVDQVIQLRDTGKRKIFRSNNQYFQEIIALRDPLIQKTLNHLKTNTLRLDHTSFAVDDTTDPDKPYIVLNFLPGTTTELYLRLPTIDSDVSNRPTPVGEFYLFTWDSKVVNGPSGNRIVVRIDMERDPSVDGGATPKVHEYKLRASF